MDGRNVHFSHILFQFYFISSHSQWMKDPRGKHAEVTDEEDPIYPCIKVFATMDSPLEDVCDFLSQKENMSQYNDLVIDHRDLEEISPHSKITWSQCPQILFLKVRAIAIKVVMEWNFFVCFLYILLTQIFI